MPDAGYSSEALFDALAGRTELVVAIGREGKEPRAINEVSLPLTAAMAQKMKAQEARDAYRRRTCLAEPLNGWIKNVLGFRQFNLRSDGRGSLRLEWFRAIGDPVTSNLRFHTQLFYGYGDTLADYNRKRTVLTVGLSLVDF